LRICNAQPISGPFCGWTEWRIITAKMAIPFTASRLLILDMESACVGSIIKGCSLNFLADTMKKALEI
jgi:hypothetical protein